MRGVAPQSRRHRLYAWTALVLAFSLLAVVSGGPVPGQAQSKTTLTFSIGPDPNHLDPPLLNATQGTNIANLIAETLTTFFNESGTLRPMLATSWQSTPDLLTWTFDLRQGVKFTDGTPFNAAAVKASFDRLLSPDIVAPAIFALKYVKTVTVVGPYRVSFALSKPLAYFPEAVANETGAITSPASWNRNGNTYLQAEQVVGTGPYKLVRYTKGSEVLLARNDDYWGKKPYFAQMLFKAVGDAASREAQLRSGQLDLIVSPPAADITALQHDSGLRVMLPYGRIAWIGINTQSRTQPLLKDRRVRQALNYAVDKETIVKNILFGAATVSDTPVPHNVFGYCKIGPYNYDPAKAKQLLTEAGASNMTLTFIAPTGRYLQDIQTAQAVAGYLRDAGIKLTGPTTAESAAYQAEVMQPPATSKTELSMWAFVAAFPDAGQYLSPTLTTGGIPPNGFNNSLYSNPAVDELITRGDAGANKAARTAAYCKAQQLAWEDAPEIFLWSLALPVVQSARISGVSVEGGYIFPVYARPR